jgi:hypothetical protein
MFEFAKEAKEVKIEKQEFSIIDIDTIVAYKNFKHPKLILAGGSIVTIGLPIFVLSSYKNSRGRVPVAIAVGLLSFANTIWFYDEFSTHTLIMSEWTIKPLD